MKLRSPINLGLAFDERGITCAEVAAGGNRHETRRLGRFVYPAGAALAEPAACGAALKTFLAEHGFSAGRALIGVPAKWLLASDRELPPSDPEAAAAVLRMHGERMSLADGGNELVVDVAGEIRRDASRAMVVGILRPQLDRLIAVAKAADLDVVGVTSTSLVAYTNASRDAGAIVLMGDAGTELITGDVDAPRSLRHVSSADPRTESGLTQLAGELRRTMTIAGRPAGARIWDVIGLGEDRRIALGDRAGLAVESAPTLNAKATPEALNGAAGGQREESFASAVALAVAGTARQPLPIDFVSSRLAPPVVRRFGRRTAWAATIAISLLAAAVLLVWNVRDREAEAAELNSRLKTLAPDIATAKAIVTRVGYGRGYYESRPPVLGGIREVSLAFEFGDPIWATSFRIGENGRGLLQGRTTNQQSALALLDRLKASPHVADAQLVDLRAAGGRAGEQTFSISFVYTGSD